MRPFRYLILLIVLMIGTGWAIASSGSQVESLMPYTETSQVVVDGIIDSEEYTGLFEDSATGMSIYWEHDGENMYIGMISPGMGWVGIGFGPPEIGMDGANIIIGFVDDTTGTVSLSDFIGLERWQHKSDIAQGGEDNIIEKAGTQSIDGTIIEFIYPLSSGDVYDHNFKIEGTYGFFLAYHESSDDYASYHAARSETYAVRIGSPGELPPPVTTGTESVLTMDLPEVVEQLVPFNISVHLTDIEGTPLEGESIQFYILTTFGDLLIGESLTNAVGLAQLEYAHPRPELIEVKASFESTALFEASQTIGSVSVLLSENLEDEFPEVLRIPGTETEVSLDVLILSLILVFVFGSIYITYFRVFYSLFRIPKARALEEVRPEELRFEDIELERE